MIIVLELYTNRKKSQERLQKCKNDSMVDIRKNMCRMKRKGEVAIKASLVIMAAGIGSRYGGDKQVDGIGPHNEILMEYSVYDAIRAGFERVVFIIKPELEQLVDRLCGDYLKEKKTLKGEPLEVVYAFQDYSSIPGFYTIPPERTKPFGTVHALLCAKEAVDGPFAVINADDYYGVDAYRTMYKTLMELPEQGQAAMVGYLLQNTASLNGTVTRGVCTVEDGWLRSVKETMKIQLFADGSVWDQVEKRELDPKGVVSMNFWGFMPSVFGEMERYFERFLRETAGDSLTAECLLPVMVDHLMSEDRLSVRVLHSADRWFGMTYHQDRAIVGAALDALHKRGVYPDSLQA